MDSRAYVVAVLFGFAGGLLIPRSGSDRKTVLLTLGLVVVVGIVTWLLSADPFAGPSLTVGAISGILGAVARSLRKAPKDLPT
jgi:hypothetical protein